MPANASQHNFYRAFRTKLQSGLLELLQFSPEPVLLEDCRKIQCVKRVELIQTFVMRLWKQFRSCWDRSRALYYGQRGPISHHTPTKLGECSPPVWLLGCWHPVGSHDRNNSSQLDLPFDASVTKCAFDML